MYSEYQFMALAHKKLLILLLSQIFLTKYFSPITKDQQFINMTSYQAVLRLQKVYFVASQGESQNIFPLSLLNLTGHLLIKPMLFRRVTDLWPIDREGLTLTHGVSFIFHLFYPFPVFSLSTSSCADIYNAPHR